MIVIAIIHQFPLNYQGGGFNPFEKYVPQMSSSSATSKDIQEPLKPTL